MKLSQTAQFKKDVKRQLRQGKNQAKLIGVVQILLTGSDLPLKHRDHPLKGVWNSRRMGSDFQSHANELLTHNFQREIRNSELWPQMAQFSEVKAEALLLQCKGELR